MSTVFDLMMHAKYDIERGLLLLLKPFLIEIAEFSKWGVKWEQTEAIIGLSHLSCDVICQQRKPQKVTDL